MRDIIFQELRECNRTISQINDANEKENGNQKLVAIVEKMCELVGIGRKEGLLALEDAANDTEDVFNGKYLKFMLLLIVDGTAPEVLEEICTAKYFSANLTGYEALHYLIMMFGSIALQQGEQLRIIEEKLLALIPDDAAEIYRRKKAEHEDDKAESGVHLLEQYYNGDVAAKLGDEYYFELKATDYAIRSLDNREIQRVLREVENSDLELAMKGLSGEARHKLFDNLSNNLALMIAEDLEFMGSVRLKDISAAVVKILNVIIQLINSGEVACADGEVLNLFAKIFAFSDKKAAEQEEVESDICKLMREYNSMSHKAVNMPWHES